MPIIAAGIVNKQGRIILSRNFNEISRIRIEGLLSAFPRLLESSVNKQVTYIDAGSVRYVYQPLEDLFLVLITTKSSNIVEDLATLHLMGRLIPEYVDAISESSLEAKAFEVFFALDEVIVGGKRENTTVDQIKTYLGMESHEEMMAREEKRIQMEKAKKDAARRAHELREKRRKGVNPYSGIGSDDPNYGGFGGAGAASAEVASSHVPPPSNPTAPPTQRAGRAGGMSLGRARKTDMTSKVLKESGLPAGGRETAEAVERPIAAESTAEGVHVAVEERMRAQLGRDGGGGLADIRGELSVLVSDPQLARVRLALGPVSADCSFRAHAKIHKEMFADDRVLAMREGKPFPVQQPVTILRWRLVEPGTVPAPVTLTCWPSAESITVEYELTNTTAAPLREVRFVFPLHGAAVAALEASVGVCEEEKGRVVWDIPIMDAHQNASGNVEITLDGEEAPGNVFFPVDISFTSSTSIGMVRVMEVVDADSGVPVRFSQEVKLSTEDYTVP